jgi:hypothetical protein
MLDDECHLERNVVIGEAEGHVQSKDPMPVSTTSGNARRSLCAVIG